MQVHLLESQKVRTRFLLLVSCPPILNNTSNDNNRHKEKRRVEKYLQTRDPSLHFEPRSALRYTLQREPTRAEVQELIAKQYEERRRQGLPVPKYDDPMDDMELDT